jgi:hypothetical protein
MPTGDAATDAAGRGQLFESIVVEGFTDIVEGTNGIALADLNHDGLVDIIATYTAPNNWRDAEGNRLRVFLNQGDLRFQLHPITIRNSELTGESFGLSPQIPNLVDVNGDGLLDIFITRSAPMLAGEPVAGMTPLGNTLLLSDGAWDTFRDVSAQLGARNETAYNRQSSFGDVNKDGWLDIAVGCDNIGNAMGGVPHSRLYVFRSDGSVQSDGSDRSTAGLLPGHFEDIGGSDLVPDFGGFYHDSAKDKAGPGITLRDLDNDGDLDLVQSFHCDVRQPLLPYSPGEYRQGVFCWKNLLAETGKLHFEKITGNGLACEARLKYDRDRQLYEPVGKAPGLPYVFAADVDNDGLLDLVFAADPDNSGGGRAQLPPDRYQDKVYWNTGLPRAKENHWLRLRFSGVSDAELIGARVEAREPGSGKLLGTRWVHANHSYKSGCPLEAHFGLGKTTVVNLKVTLINGRTGAFTATPANRFLDVDLRTSTATPVRQQVQP